MTVIVAIAHQHLSFVATDTLRWDFGLGRAIGPVGKLWAKPDAMLLKAGAGSTADPSMEYVLNEICIRGCTDENLKQIADRIDPAIQTAKLKSCQDNGVPFAEEDYAMIAVSTQLGHGQVSSYAKHSASPLELYPYGVAASGTNSSMFAKISVEVLERASKTNVDRLDLRDVAFEIVRRCSEKEPKFVGLPVDCGIIRVDSPGRFTVQRTLADGQRDDARSIGNAVDFVVPRGWIAK